MTINSEQNMITNTPKKKERAVAFVVARLSSSRLPAKQFKLIGDKSILSWIIDNLRACRELDEIVLTTVAEEANEPLRTFANQEGLPCFWYQGEVDHVTTRLRKAAEAYAADICLLISADCPLVYGPEIDQLIIQMRSRPKADRLIILPDAEGRQPALEGVQVARKKAWQLADDLADRPELKEHQFPLLWMRPELFSPHRCHLAKNLYAPAHRFSVDTRADLEFMNSLHDRLTAQNRPFTLPEALGLLQRDPELTKINRHVHQRRLAEPNHKVLIAIDSGAAFGFGHLMRSLEIADQLTERQGWPVVFLVDDEQTAKLLTQRGLAFKWGAFARETNPRQGQTCPPLKELLSEYSLLVLDIYDQRGATIGWREELNAPLPIAVIDNRLPWAAEADLIITPGVTAETCDIGVTPDAGNQLAGIDYLILRREIRRELGKNQVKELDLLVYLHDEKQRALVSDFASRYDLRAEILNSFSSEMPRLMAQARYYLSGFGISFYEALALGTLPVCWPDSKAHLRDVTNFYQCLAITPCILRSAADLETRLLPLLRSRLPLLPSLQDGTPRVIAALSALVENYQPQMGTENR